MDRLTGGEYGFLLLTSHLGNPERKPLTTAQFRELFKRSDRMREAVTNRDVKESDFTSIGYSPKAAAHMVSLLGEESLLHHYLERGRKAGCVPVTRATADYPVVLRQRLGLDSPGVLWAKGDLSILQTPAISLVGSRELNEKNARFASEVGRQAALQGYTLVSGNARGADKIAQRACLEAGGLVISVVADSLENKKQMDNVLWLSEDSFDMEFSPQRALSRNRVIHGMGLKTFVAQSSLRTGGTWDGTVKNLRFGWSPVFCYDDGSVASVTLAGMGATLVGIHELNSIYDLTEDQQKIL